MFMTMRSNRRHPTDSTQGFTLAELLIVILIIGIMLVVALPSFMNISGASKLDAAANTVHAAAKMARQYARTQNQPTYLVFHDAQTSTNLAYRTYAIFTINVHTNPVSQASGYFLADWKTLPSGVVFDNSVEEDHNLFTPSSAGAWNGAISKNNLLYIQDASYIVLGFEPNGTTGKEPRRIYLAEGFYSSETLQHTEKQGKQIRFDRTGKSHMHDILYQENGEITELSE